MHKSHNTCDHHCFNEDGTPIKKHGGAGKPSSKEKGNDDANFAQMVHMEMK